MILKDTFYTVGNIQQTPTGYEVRVTLNPAHPVYAGHFPQQPVVPGMCTLTIIREVLGDILGAEVMFRQIRECKFVSAVIPREGLGLDLSIILSDNQVRCIIMEEDKVVLKLKAEI